MKKIAIVGKGPVGLSIKKSIEKHFPTYEIHSFNTKNIQTHKDYHYDLLIYAGVPGVKWKANQNPKEDLQLMYDAYDTFLEIDAKSKILISSIDVINNDSGEYGRNRLMLESWVLRRFEADDREGPSHRVVRLPALIGTEVKKNQWFDSINSLPNQMNYEMVQTVNKVTQYLELDEEAYIELLDEFYHIKYHPSKEYWASNDLGIHLAHHPDSLLMWLDIEDLGYHLLKTVNYQSKEPILLCSHLEGKIGFTIKDVYYNADDYNDRMPESKSMSDYEGVINKINHFKNLKETPNMQIINEIQFHKYQNSVRWEE